MRLEPYREAWHLLQSDTSASGVEIQAMADESFYPGSPHVGTDALVEAFKDLTWLIPRPTKPVITPT